MNRKLGTLIGILFVGLLIVAGVVVANGSQPKRDNLFTRDPIVKLAEEIDYDGYNLDSIIAADENTGNIAEKISGQKDADIIIYEYADYGCSHCADANSTINKLVSDYDGKVAVVFRELVLQFPNSVSSASAATAAGIQGYWEKYKNLLYSNQAEWYYLKNEKRDAYFENLFVEASNGEGDLEKFKEDYTSDEVKQRLAFNYGAASDLEITATPNFRINGEKVLLSELQDKIEELLAE